MPNIIVDTLKQLETNIKVVETDMFHKGLKFNESLLKLCLKDIEKIKKELK